MFKSLKRRIILGISLTSAFVLAVCFILIYAYVARTNISRTSIPSDAPLYRTELNNIIEQRIGVERTTSQNELLVILIIAGLSVEGIVFILSIFFAEKMVKPVREAYESQKLFVAHAAHELKTPIAAIEANLEAADIEGNHWIDNVSFETEKLASLNRELLELSRSDLGKEKEKPSQVDLRSIIMKNLETKKPRMKGKKIKVYGKKTKTLLAKKDFESIYNILLDNAIKYSDKTIEIHYDSTKLIIKNDGKTIPKKKLPHIFDRFYQVDKNSEGVGLGLSIAKSLAENNHWKLSAKSENMTEFVLTLK